MDRKRARRRALRAAQVVTLGLAIAGCGESHELGTDGGATDAPPDADADEDEATGGEEGEPDED